MLLLQSPCQWKSVDPIKKQSVDELASAEIIKES